MSTEILARRQVIAREIEAAQGELAEAFPELRAVATDAQAALEAAQKAHESAATRQRGAYNAVHGAKAVASRRIRDLRLELEATADPAIGLLHEAVVDQLRWARNYPPMGTPREEYSGRLEALAGLVDEIDGLRYQAIAAAELRRRLEALEARRSSLPGAHVGAPAA